MSCELKVDSVRLADCVRSVFLVANCYCYCAETFKIKLAMGLFEVSQKF
jgi:hypothetical protein